MRVSQNFTRKEFSCKCGCNFNTADILLVNVLEKLRKYLNHNFGECYIEITSGNRCESHNKAIGGASQSKHVKGIAADIKAYKKDTHKQIHEKYIYNWLEIHYPNSFGIGRYDTWTHVDMRPTRARWDNRKKK